MTDPIGIANNAAIVLCIIGLLLCIIALRLGSIARSLQKIADRETKNVVYFPADSQLPDGLRNDIAQIAWEAGRNFQAGMRTDR